MRTTFALFILVFISMVPGVRAQEFGRVGDVIAEGGISYHAFVRPGEATVRVLVLGDRGSGIYEVGAETDLASLLALTGGVTTTPRERQDVRQVTIRLLRMREGRREAVYEASQETLLTEPGQYPELREGDVVAVEVLERRPFGWRDGISIVTAVAALALAVERVASLL